MYRIEGHHIFFKTLGGGDETYQFLEMAAYLHRGGKGIGLHQKLLKATGQKSWRKLNAYYNTAKPKQKKEYIDKLRSGYKEFFTGSPDYDEIMKQVNTALDAAKESL